MRKKAKRNAKPTRLAGVKSKPTPKSALTELAKMTAGHALIHKEKREIALATIRSDRKLVQRLGNVFRVNGSYRIGKVTVREFQ